MVVQFGFDVAVLLDGFAFMLLIVWQVSLSVVGDLDVLLFYGLFFLSFVFTVWYLLDWLLMFCFLFWLGLIKWLKGCLCS